MSQARVSITPSDAWSDLRLTPLQCRLLGLIGSYLGKDHRAWPSQNTLAGQLGVSRKAVNDGVKALREYGYIEVEHRRRDDGGQTSNCYFVRMDPVSRTGDIPCEVTVTPPSPEGDTPCNPIEVTPPVTSEGDTIKDPIERPIEQTFDLIWSAWSQTGKGRSSAKSKCLAALKAQAKKSDAETISKAAVIFAKSTDGQYHPALERWLRDGKWENWIGNDRSAPAINTLDDWTKAARDYVDLEIWDRARFGPAPHEPNCQADDRLLRGIARQMEGHRWHDPITANMRRAA